MYYNTGNMVLPLVADLAPASLGLPSLVAVGALELQSSLQVVQSSTWFLWWLKLGRCSFFKHFLQPSWGHHLCPHHKTLFEHHQKMFSSNGVPCSCCFFWCGSIFPASWSEKHHLRGKKEMKCILSLSFVQQQNSCGSKVFSWMDGPGQVEYRAWSRTLKACAPLSQDGVMSCSSLLGFVWIESSRSRRWFLSVSGASLVDCGHLSWILCGFAWEVFSLIDRAFFSLFETTTYARVSHHGVRFACNSIASRKGFFRVPKDCGFFFFGMIVDFLLFCKSLVCIWFPRNR